MCYTPLLSLSTAIIEYGLAALAFRYHRTRFRDLLITSLVLLATYQITEYMFCTTSNDAWIVVGFIAYTFLPAVGVHTCIRFAKKAVELDRIYVLPAWFSFTALIANPFVINASCLKYLLFVDHLYTVLDGTKIIPTLGYIAYYGSFVLYGYYLLSQETHDLQKRRVANILIVGLGIATVPAILIYFLRPYVPFPSLWCQFALTYAVACFASIHLESRLKKPFF